MNRKCEKCNGTGYALASPKEVAEIECEEWKTRYAAALEREGVLIEQIEKLRTSLLWALNARLETHMDIEIQRTDYNAAQAILKETAP
jgi:hypothetical protein